MITLLSGAHALGCGGGWATTTEPSRASRRPDGVVLETPQSLPTPTDRAEAGGVIALRAPVPEEDVEDVVRQYLRAFEREDEAALVGLLAEDATSLSRPGSTRQQLVDGWRTKLKSFDYQRIGGAEIARFAMMERYTYEAFAGGEPVPRPSSMRPGDLYVRVPMSLSRLGADPLFGETIVFLLRREDGRLRIAGQADEGTR